MSKIIPYDFCNSRRGHLKAARRITGRHFSFNSRNRSLVGKLKEFQTGNVLEKFDAPDLLSEYRKQSFLEADLSQYSFIVGFGQGNHGPDNNYYADSSYQFVLMNNGSYAAVLGFEPQPNGILVLQLQGIGEMGDVLKPLKWTKALLNLATDWAREAEISEIFVLPHERNKWSKVQKGENNTKLYYDITARREGFKYDDSRGVYAKKLN